MQWILTIESRTSEKASPSSLSSLSSSQSEPLTDTSSRSLEGQKRFSVTGSVTSVFVDFSLESFGCRFCFCCLVSFRLCRLVLVLDFAMLKLFAGKRTWKANRFVERSVKANVICAIAKMRLMFGRALGCLVLPSFSSDL